MIGFLIIALITAGDSIRNYITSSLAPGAVYSESGEVAGVAEPSMFVAIIANVHAVTFYIPVYEALGIYIAAISAVITIRGVRWAMRVSAVGTSLGG